ncbi:hypothetical protein H5410_049207 [Solanum commersonii]|uniref:Uncharacterized protein n=1 Tax=Solanum commersonii TaxID=4109 RepID=A0A9J5XLP5_SOLCO|nr:hypothetical protein H5410_049207 [Solanum commersonii]
MEPVDPHAQNDPFSMLNESRSSQLALSAITSHFQGETNPGAEIFSRTSIMTLSMDPVETHGQNIPFSRSNKAQSRPYLWSQLALTVKMSHFQGQTNPGGDFSYGASQPSWPKRPIFKVKRASLQTLAMEPVGTHGQNVPFSWSNEPWRRNFSWTSVKILVMKPVGPHGQNSPFSMSIDLRSSQLALTAKRPIFKVKQSPEQMSVKSLAIEPVGLNGQNIPFSRSNESWSRTLDMELVVPNGQNIPFSRSNEP